MDDKYRKLSAYERRKINSQKIAQVQFEPKGHSPEQYMTHSPKQFKNKTEKEWKEHKKDVWTPTDQKQEEELWDE